jgi:hypothetical protein
MIINSFESALSSIVLLSDPNLDRPVEMVSLYSFVLQDWLSFHSHGHFLIFFLSFCPGPVYPIVLEHLHPLSSNFYCGGEASP